MAAIVKGSIKIIDNMLEVIPDEPIEDNCQYEIRLKDVRSADGNAVLDSYTCKVVTALSPAYCNVSDVAILVDEFKIPQSTILYYIREASRYVDFIREVSEIDTTEVTFAAREFVKTKVMIDCLLKAYVAKAAGSGLKGTLGEISFENTEKYANNINDLLDDLWKRLKGWEDALKGNYVLEGRARPSFAIKASKTTKDTYFNEIVDSMERKLPTVHK